LSDLYGCSCCCLNILITLIVIFWIKKWLKDFWSRHALKSNIKHM
jgi:uncharacterized membrane protein YcjF (UPF0283 family)